MRSPPFPLKIAVGTTVFAMPREDGLDLLEWLGLGRPEFGAIDASELLPLCRRRLWPEPHNCDPPRRARAAGTLRRLVERLAATMAASPEGLVLFG